MSKTQLAVIAALGLIGGQAIAEETAAGPYVGGAIGQVRLEDSLGSISLDADDTGFKLFGGYAFNQYFSIELAYIEGGSPEDNIEGFTVESEPSAIQASVIGTVPISETFGMYLRAALLSWESEVFVSDGFTTATGETDGEDLSWGIGGSLNIGARGAVRLEYESADLDGTDVSIISVSGLIRF